MCTLYFTRQDIYIDDCSVCSSIYDWLPIWYLQTSLVISKNHPIHSVSVLLYFQLAISVSICILYVIYHHMYYIVSNGEDLSKFHSLCPILLLFFVWQLYLSVLRFTASCYPLWYLPGFILLLYPHLTPTLRIPHISIIV
jgi:hypothetical protein